MKISRETRDGVLHTTEPTYNSESKQTNPLYNLRPHQGNEAKKLLKASRLTPRYNRG